MEGDFQPKAIWDWLMTCPLIKDLYFQFGEAANENTVLVPVTAYKDRTVKAFIDGSAIRHCDFALVRFEAVSTEPNSTQNIDTQQHVESLAAWIDEQGGAGNFPVFPATRRPQRVYALPTETGFVSAQGEHMAKFMLQFRIEYYCEE